MSLSNRISFPGSVKERFHLYLLLWTLVMWKQGRLSMWLRSSKVGVKVGNDESSKRREELSKDTGRVVIRHRSRISTGQVARSGVTLGS